MQDLSMLGAPWIAAEGQEILALVRNRNGRIIPRASLTALLSSAFSVESRRLGAGASIGLRARVAHCWAEDKILARGL